MALFPLLLAAHLLGDWVIQTDWQAANKTDSWRANQHHMIGYHLTLGGAAVLAAPLHLAAVIVAVSWVTHSVIDRRWPVKQLLRATGSARFAETTWGVLAADQALHLSILAVLAAVVEGVS